MDFRNSDLVFQSDSVSKNYEVLAYAGLGAAYVGALIVAPLPTAAVTLLAAAACAPSKGSAGDSEAQDGGVQAGQVVDGNTFVTDDGQTIDLIGVANPAADDPCFAQAKTDLESIINGKSLTIKEDSYSADEAQSQPRYVYLPDKTFVNEQMLLLGDVRGEEGKQIDNVDKLKNAEKDAREAGRGCVWAGVNGGSAAGDTATVASVTDGKNFTTADGRQIDLIGVTLPKAESTCFPLATADLQNLVMGQPVRLESDPYNVQETAPLGRYAFLSDDTFVNEYMIRGGNVYADISGPRILYSKKLEDAQAEAKKAQRGCLWEGCYEVSSVTDPDTFKYKTPEGDVVNLRLLGVDGAEKKKFCFDEGKDALTSRIDGRFVRISTDESVSTDMYGRQLGYVSVCEDGNQEAEVNMWMVRMGYACTYMHKDLRLKTELEQAQIAAKDEGAGCWGESTEAFCPAVFGCGVASRTTGLPQGYGCDEGGTGDGGPGQTQEGTLTCDIAVEDDATCLCMADIEAEGTEYALLGNRCNTGKDVGGWTVSDAPTATGRVNTYTIPAGFTMPACAAATACGLNGFDVTACQSHAAVEGVKLYTEGATASDTASELHMDDSAVWNNGGDSATIANPAGNDASVCSY